jgi:hypothetical protein
MDQDPSFPPLSFVVLSANPLFTRAAEGQLDQFTHAISETCVDDDVKVNLRAPKSTMCRSHSDSDLREHAHPLNQSSPHSLRLLSISRRRSQDPKLPVLQISKARPSIAIDLLSGILPTPEAMLHPLSNPTILLCPTCRTPRPLTHEGQATTVCQACLTAFKTAEKKPKSSQRRGSTLTSFPPLLDTESTESDHEDTKVEVEGGSRKLSIVEGITRVFGMLRGGAVGSRKGSRRGSETSLESWRDGGSGASESRPASRSSCTYSSSSQ